MRDEDEANLEWQEVDWQRQVSGRKKGEEKVTSDLKLWG